MAPFNAAGGTQAGRAYVYYGGTAPNATADLVLTGAADDELGFAVNGGGDIDGDGYADVFVGAPTGSGARPGWAYAYFGGPGVDPVPDLSLAGALGGDFFGQSVCSSKDLNGDGFADLVVGAPMNDAAGANAGRVYVYYGGPGADSQADLVFTGAAASDNFGNAVSAAGDLRGDGFPDVIIGAPMNDAAGSNAGRAYLYDCNRYFLTTPNGGETWNVGATKTISWLGAEPADVWLSTDGGRTQQLLESGVGGLPTNTLTLRVPHAPTKFGQIKVIPSDAAILGFDRSDSLFTIQMSVALLSLLAAPAPNRGGAVITWETDPRPEELAGYRLEKTAGGAGAGASWQTLVPLTKETSHLDEAAGTAGARYRLFAVNGFGEELMLGETLLRPAASLSAWPLPYREGNLTVSFASAGGLGGGVGETELRIFDLQGRLVRSLARGSYPQGFHTTTWDGKDEQGRDVASGIYFLRSSSLGDKRNLRITVLR